LNPSPTRPLRDFITIVSGLPRSGTSSMMQMLQAGGLPILSDGVRVADENNRRGYLEYEPVKRLRADRTWLPQARGQAVKIIHLLLRDLLLGTGLRYRIVFMQRPVEEVLASQAAMLARDGKPAGDPVVLAKAFESQLAQVHAWLANQADIAVLPVAYHDMLHDPMAAATAVDGFVDGGLDTAAMAAVVDPALHRQRRS
jgi:hypothetical protein